MRTIERTAEFKKDFKKQGNFLDNSFIEVLYKLINDEPLPVKYKDHSLNGNWKNYRECHIKPDLLLIYKKIDLDTLILVRLNSHSELF